MLLVARFLSLAHLLASSEIQLGFQIYGLCPSPVADWQIQEGKIGKTLSSFQLFRQSRIQGT